MSTCPHCGVRFDVRREWQRFCSGDCRQGWHNSRRRKAMRLLDAAEPAQP